jgi:hypothetical protein
MLLSFDQLPRDDATGTGPSTKSQFEPLDSKSLRGLHSSASKHDAVHSIESTAFLNANDKLRILRTLRQPESIGNRGKTELGLAMMSAIGHIV